METYQDRLLYIINKLNGGNKKQFSDKSGINHSSIYEVFLKERFLSGKNEFKLTKLSVNLNWLKSGEGEPFLNSLPSNASEITDFNKASDFILIPLLDLEVGAGNGIEVNGETKSKGIDFSSGWIRSQLKVSPKDLVAVTVDGDSMSPTIEDGNIILVDKSQRAIKNGLVYVFRRDNSLLVKRLEILADGSILVKSDNPEYQKATLKRDEFEQLKLIGKVIWRGGEI